MAARAAALQLRWGEAADEHAALAWNAGSPFDVIVGTDVVFAERWVEPLLRSMRRCAGQRTVVWLCLQERCAAAHALLLARAPAYFAEQVRHGARRSRSDYHSEVLIICASPSSGCCRRRSLRGKTAARRWPWGRRWSAWCVRREPALPKSDTLVAHLSHTCRTLDAHTRVPLFGQD